MQDVYSCNISQARVSFFMFSITSILFVLILNMILIMHPAQPSEARLGGVHFIFCHIQILTRLLQVELFRGYYVYCMHI